MPDLRFFFVAPRKIAFQLTRWLYLPQRAGILLSLGFFNHYVGSCYPPPMQEIMQFVGRHPILSIALDRVTGGGSCDYV